MPGPGDRITYLTVTLHDGTTTTLSALADGGRLVVFFYPKAFTAATRGGKTETDEVAVMVDTRDALDVAAMPAGVEFDGYVASWQSAETKQAAE